MIFNENGEILNEGLISKLKEKINSNMNKKIDKYYNDLKAIKYQEPQKDKHPIIGEINGMPIKLYMDQDKYNKNKSFYDNGIKKIKAKYSSAIKQVKSEMIADGEEYEEFAELPKLPIDAIWLTDYYNYFYDDLVCCLEFEIRDEKILPGNYITIAMAVNDSGEFDAAHYAIG